MHFRILSILFFLVSATVFAQNDSIPDPNWDNQIYIGNKVSFGKGKWNFSGEWQVRLENNMQQLDNWFIEGVASYLVWKNMEIVPDFRFTVKTDRLEYRPGFGVLYKATKKDKFQWVNQVKWQLDIDTRGRFRNGVRGAMFFNYVFSEMVMGLAAAGAFYRWQSDFNGFQFVRVGPGVALIFDKRHALNLYYFISMENMRNYWSVAGIPMVQLVINLTKLKKYTYTPAFYFDF